MKLEVIDFFEKEKWIEFEQNGIEIYYTWEYVAAFYKIGDGVPVLIYINENEQYVFNVFMKRDIALDKNFENDLKKDIYFDIITPYGYGGIDIIGEYDKNLIDQFHKLFEQYCINNNIISEFIRLNPTKNNYKYYCDNSIVNNSSTICINLKNEQQIWDDMESRGRNTIRKVKKFNIKIKFGFNEIMFKEFQEIYYDTMKRDNANSYYFFDSVFFEDIRENLKYNAFIATAYFDEKPIASSIFLYANKIGHYHLSGTLTEYLKYGCNSLILYEAAKKLYSLGCNQFHLGGGYGGDESSLFKFKKSFTKDGVLDFYIGKKIYNQDIYERLVDIRKSQNEFDNETRYFPKYRG